MDSRILDLELKSRATLHFLISCCFGRDEEDQEIVSLQDRVLNSLPLFTGKE